ncbi:CAP domain-containing protein [Flavobacterium seoulense]|uniref:Allergen V5/Tpx-1 family protein n=1 Tax=Flavobacterium seoulense TaxID=1492738 RepID=A0A066WS27_9FLAO|nr:CAP domain-containing protein [Flavobacterium seoulense]KDN53799.1 allergen V5/Tpx-1 family protein [Flavobacterium seoulense]
MKVKLLNLMLLFTVIFTMNSCSSDSSEETADSVSAVVVENYTYSEVELETMKLINDYRVSIGLNPLEKINHISFKSEEHDYYMIDKKAPSHDGFVDRSNNIMKLLGATTVAENVAFNYNSPEAAVKAWLNSAGHKANIVGNYTHFGISIRQDAATGKKYYTNIFARID